MKFLCYLFGHKLECDSYFCIRCKVAKPLVPVDLWKEVPGGLYRIEVPGGWIYQDSIRGHSIAMCFVPYSKETK